jgi:hypothetical protein
MDADGPGSCATGCAATAPVCDQMTQLCRGCVADSECGGACHELAGTCTGPGETLFVSPQGTDGPCSRNAPCRTITAAIALATSQKRVIAVADGTYTDAFSIRNGAIISGADRAPAGAVIMLGAGAGTLQSDSATTSVIEGVSIAGGGNDGFVNRGTVTLSRVSISMAGRHGIDNRGGDLTVLDSRIERSSNTGISSNSTLRVERTVVYDNSGTGIVANGGFTIINTIVASNGTMTGPSPGGVRLSHSAGQAAVFQFNTLSENDVAAGGVTGIQCDSVVVLENSIFADVDGLFTTETGGNCTARYSMFDAMPLAGTGNFAGDAMFVNQASDFHLAAGSPAIDKADPAATESLDVDGEARPAGTVRDIGADERP